MTFIEDSLYKEILENTVIAPVDIIFLNEKNEILLGKRTNKPLQGAWYFPWWRIHKWETLKQCAVRKALEETWINIIVPQLRLLGAYDDIFPDSAIEGISTHCVASMFVYRLSVDEISIIKTDAQHDEMRFFTLDDESHHLFLKRRLEEIGVERILGAM